MLLSNALIVSAALTGCTPGSSSVAGPVSWDYFPLQVGNQWVFKELSRGVEFTAKITGVRYFENEAFFVFENLPELGLPRQVFTRNPQRYLRYDAHAHQLVEYSEHRRIILLDLEPALSGKFPLTTSDRLLGGRTIPAGSYDDHTEQGNCAYDPTCSLGRTIYVPGIGPVAHARFSRRPKQSAEYAYYLEEATINGVHRSPFFAQEVRLPWNDSLSESYQTCSPPSQFLDAKGSEARFEVRDTTKTALGARIVRVAGSDSAGPFPAGMTRAKTSRLEVELSASELSSQWTLNARIKSPRPKTNIVSSYTFVVQMDLPEGPRSVVCYLAVEPAAN